MKFFGAAILLSLLACLAAAQTLPMPSSNAAAEWIRVSSNDGEFSIEVPAKHRFFADPNGFVIGKDSNDYELKDMYLLTSFVDGTLVSFEAYEASKGALDALYNLDALGQEGRQESEKKIGKTKVKEVINKTDSYYAVRRFVSTKKHIYLLTAASRNGETAEMRRFLDSFNIDIDASGTSDVETFASLKVDPLTVEYLTAAGSPRPSSTAAPKPPPDPTAKPVLIIRTTRGSYVPAARARRTMGNVRLGITCAPDGSIPNVRVISSLPDGLERQSIFAAIRTRFLPAERNGVPVQVIKTLEFGYKIY